MEPSSIRYMYIYNIGWFVLLYTVIDWCSVCKNRSWKNGRQWKCLCLQYNNIYDNLYCVSFSRRYLTIFDISQSSIRPSKMVLLLYAICFLGKNPFFYIFFLFFIFLNFLSFDYCRFCVVIRLFHLRHNGQWPPTSKDFLSQI